MTVAACLIVKNESLVIRRCLDSLRGLVQAVVIVDTGSTDDTLAVIRGLDFSAPIHLHQRAWKNFADNRTELLRLASPAADYLLLLDADYTVEGRLPTLTADAYALLLRTPSLEYRKPLLIRSALPWRYEGVVHEYLVCEHSTAAEPMDSLTIRDHVDGGHRPPGWQPRWEWDAAVLEEELTRDPANARNVFYLARSYDDLAMSRPNDSRSGDWRQKAMDRYRERSMMAGYADEAYYSLYRLGVLRLAEGDGLAILLEAWQRCPHRWEPVHEAARWLNQRGLHQASYALSKQALTQRAEPSGLFISPDVYDHLLLFEHSISAYYAGQDQESLDACNALLARPLPPHIEAAVRRNLAFPQQRLARMAPVAPCEWAYDLSVPSPGHSKRPRDCSLPSTLATLSAEPPELPVGPESMIPIAALPLILGGQGEDWSDTPDAIAAWIRWQDWL
jgi:glycosyltransferase involved in cell wall biosynthesis